MKRILLIIFCLLINCALSAQLNYWGLSTVNQHFVSYKIGGASTLPTITPGAGNGTGGGVSFTTGSNDASGRISISTGTAPAAGAIICSVTFLFPYYPLSTGYPGPLSPRSMGNMNIFLQPVNSAAANLTNSQIIIPGNVSNAGFNLLSTGALAASTNYVWSYWVIQ
jgi:hypothetical protein